LSKVIDEFIELEALLPQAQPNVFEDIFQCARPERKNLCRCGIEETCMPIG